MSTVLNFANWKRLYEADGAMSGGPDDGKKKSPGSPEGWTDPNSGYVYKYPFKDSLAYSTFVNIGSRPLADGGADGNDAALKALLPKISPKFANLVLRGTFDPNADRYQKGAGESLQQGVKTLLELTALLGVGPISPEAIIQKANQIPKVGMPTFTKTHGAIEGFSKDASAFLKELTEWEQYKQYKGASTDFRTSWPTIWKEQRKAAGLPEEMPVVASTVPAKTTVPTKK